MKHILKFSMQSKGAVEMMEGETSYRRKKISADQFTDTVFSWSLEDISNENLYKDKVS